MIFTQDTQKIEDPNIFGELIRDYAFVKKDEKYDFGCYSIFELKPEFKKVEDGEIYKNFLLFLDMDELDGKPSVYTNGSINIGWYWDGDGTLCVQEGDRIAINTDCKTDYCWEWV